MFAILRHRRIQVALLAAEEARIHLGQQHRIVIGGAAQHHAVDMAQMLVRLFQRLDAAIDQDGEAGSFVLHAIDQAVIQRRHVAVFLGRQAFQPRFAGMNREHRHAGSSAGIDQRTQGSFRILVVHPDAALHRDRNGNCSAHCGDTLRHQRRLPHKTSAEPPRLHPVRRAADIQVHFVIAKIGGNARRLRQLARIAAAQLQRQRMFAAVKRQQPHPVAVQYRIRRHHLGVQQRMSRQAAMQHPAGTVGPVHHRGDGKAVVHGGLLPPRQP